jgi:uncharacterized oxidoreductase
MKLSGNTVLITGGSSGIGLALCKKFLVEENRVLIIGRNREKLADIKRQLREIDTLHCDLSQSDSLAELLQYIERDYPELNILINNAGVQYNYHFMSEPEFIRKTEYEIATNFTAPVKLTGSLLPILQKKSNAAIVNISSGLFLAPKKSASVYCATKAAMHIYTKTLRYQLEDSGIKVFEIIPSLVDTPMTQGRGKSKISGEQLAEEFFRNFRNDKYESYIGKTKILRFLSRFFPKVADKIMKNGL